MPRTPRAASPPKRKSPPYPFLLEALASQHPEVRPMFSGFAVYVGDKIVAMLRDSPKAPEDNGLWLVLSEITDPGDPDLRRDLPSLRTIGILGGKIGHWLLVPADGPDFEAESLRVCEPGAPCLDSETWDSPNRADRSAGCPIHRALAVCDEWVFAKRTVFLS